MRIRAPQPAMRTRRSSGRRPPFGAPLSCAKSPEVACDRLPASNTREGPGSWPETGRTSGAPSAPGTWTELMGYAPGRAGEMRPASSFSPKPSTPSFVPGEREVTSSGRRQYEGDGRGRDPRKPQQFSGKWGAGGVGDTLGPLQAGSIPSARSPVRRRVFWLWALPPGLGALSPARPGMLPR